MLSCDSSCCLCENKGADQLQSNPASDQHLCFRFIDSTIPLLSSLEISSLLLSSVDVKAGLRRTWSDTLKTGFLMTWLIHHICINLLVPRYSKTNIGNPGNQQN